MADISKLHRMSVKLAALLVLLALVSSACNFNPSDVLGGQLSGAPQAVAQQQEADSTTGVWIEFPREGQILPNEITTLVVVAAEMDGVGGVSAEINGVGLPVDTMTDLSTNGTNSLVKVEVLWNPPGEGQYTMTAGAGGVGTSVTFCVVNCEGVPEEEEEAPPRDTSTAAPGVTVTPTRTATKTQTPISQTEIYFWAEPETVNAGGCTMIYWEVAGAKTVTINGTQVGASGSASDCLCYSQTYNLKVVTLDNKTETRTISVGVNGYCTSPVTDTPIPPPQLPTDTPIPPPPADTSPPVMSNVTIVWEGCSVYVQANINDPSGVSWGKSSIKNNGAGGGWVWMQNIGGDLWQSEVGISVSDGMNTPVGTLEFQVQAGDSLGNQGTSTGSPHPYNGCGT